MSLAMFAILAIFAISVSPAIFARRRPGGCPRSAPRSALLAWLVLVIAGCGGNAEGTATRPSPVHEACLVTAPAAPQPDDRSDLTRRSIVMGLPGPLDPHTPLPRSLAERSLFALLYETVVHVSCDGQVQPGLAASWSAEDQGRRWTFHLRPDARDHEGGAVTASSVASSWLRSQEAGAGSGSDGFLGEPAPPRFTRVTVVDSLTLRVTLAGPASIESFARLELSVRTGSDDEGWPTGSGPYRLTGGMGDRTPVDRGAVGAIDFAGPARLTLRPTSNDGRDALDQGVELLVTTDPSVIDYSRQLPGFSTYPLSWNRTYLLVSGGARVGDPTRAWNSDRGPAVLRAPSAVLDDLARDAVRVPARAVTLPSDPESCASGGGSRSEAASTRTGRVVYPAGDPVARAIAERLVALALASSAPTAAWFAGPSSDPGGTEARIRATGLPGAAFAVALRSGRDAAYVLSAEGEVCGAIAAAAKGAPWLDREATEPARDRQPAIVPLIQTRSTLILQRGIGGVGIDGQGVLRLGGLYRFDPEASP